MALQLSRSPSPAMRADSPGSIPVRAHKLGFSSRLPAIRLSEVVTLKLRSRRKPGTKAYEAKCSLDTAVATTGGVTQVNKDDFWPIVKAAGNKTVVLDMYTQWCGPCKVMAPKFQELSEKYTDVIFLKLDCNNDNRPLAKELGLKVVPTFKILKDNQVVKEVRGAKFDELVVAIETVQSS